MSTDKPLAGRMVAILGNVGKDTYPYTTENEYSDAYASAGSNVWYYPEQDVDQWASLIQGIHSGAQFDWVQWTSTPSYRHAAGNALMWELIAACRRARIPLVGVHLDKFFDIPERLDWLANDPYFKGCDLMLTADGGDHPWEEYGINHRWLLPAVSERWCVRGEPTEALKCDVAFVGSWQGHYHGNSKHRHELINHLQRDVDARMFPRRNEPAVRGKELTDLYWSAKVVVGDSFFAGGPGTQPPPRYGSDRTPETLGRGGILLHTAIEGWNGPGDAFDMPATLTWDAWDWETMRQKIETALNWTEAVRTRKRNATTTLIKEHHTYAKRVVQIQDMLLAEGLL